MDAAATSMPAMVMQKFHNLRGGVEVPHRFYELSGKSSDRVVTFTSAMAQLATSEQVTSLEGEIDARWRIVESSFTAGVGRSLVQDGVAVDLSTMVLTDRRRRRSVTGVTGAVVGFQHGRCLICGDLLGRLDPIAVDHVFPYSLMDRSTLLGWPNIDLDAIWNLAPAHAVCHALKSNRPPTPIETKRLGERNAAIMLSPHPLRKTLELVLRSRDFAGQPNDWAPFLTHR